MRSGDPPARTAPVDCRRDQRFAQLTDTGTTAAAPDGGTAEPADLLGLLGVVCAGLLPVTRIDAMYYGAWAPRAALCLVLLFPGLVVLGRLAVAGSRPARLAAAFLAAATLSTALADKPALSLFGAANWGTGLLFLATLAGAWAVGASAGDRRRRQLLLAIIAATVANAVVAWIQVRVGTSARSAGLTGNPVHLGALAAGGLLLMGRRFGRERGSRWWLAAVALVAGAAQLSGGRAAVVLATAATLAALVGSGRARAAALLLAVAAGVLVAPLGAHRTALASARVTSESAVGTGDTRFAVWRISAGAIQERPLVGWGPGRFPAATGPRYDAIAAQEHAVLKDAHNWVVEAAVTTGLPGLALLLAWLAFAASGARGPLAGFALVVGASSLVQPLNPGLTPVAMLALGAARAEAEGRGPSRPLEWSRTWRAAAAAGMALGLAGAAVLTVGQVELQRGVQDGSPATVRRARMLSPPWPELMLAEASAEATAGLDGSKMGRRRTIAITRRATQRDPADPVAWAELGQLELVWGSERAAATAFRRGLEANPWDLTSLLGTVSLARRLGDQQALVDRCRQLRVLHQEPAGCRSAVGDR